MYNEMYESMLIIVVFKDRLKTSTTSKQVPMQVYTSSIVPLTVQLSITGLCSQLTHPYFSQNMVSVIMYRYASLDSITS